MIDDYDFLTSLNESQLESLLALHPNTASLMATPTVKDERTAQRERMAAKRASQRDIQIPPPENPRRRIEAESDAELWLNTYLPDLFTERFTEDRLEMIKAIEHAAEYGGDQAIAGPRGEGKTTLAIWCAVRLMLCRRCNFPVVIGKSQGKSQLELKDIKERLQQSDILRADYPEVCVPFEAVGGWSSRARMQTVQGVNTNIAVAADHLAFPKIKREQMPGWPEDIKPASCGQVLYCLGVDGPIRGTKFRGKRPQLAILDDIESRESAASEKVIESNEDIIEKDVAGLGASGKRVSRVMLCTIQNRKCIAYKYTDPQFKPSWRGKRYRKMIREPDRMDLVDEYIELRRMRSDEDADARIAHRYWKEHQQLLEAGCVVSNQQSFDGTLHPDGDPLEWSAVQAYYNRVADFGKDAVATEIDNDPPETVGPQGMGLTADMVASRLSGLERRQLPANTQTLTVGIDLGKYRCHWVVAAWWKGAGGCIVDYGIAEVAGTGPDMNHEASEPAIYKALLNWRDELLAKKYVDATGTERKIDAVFVDSGAFTNAAYEFVRQVRTPFYAAKGVTPYRERSHSTDKVRAGDNMHAVYLESAGLWLFDLNTDYWKNWTHERFLTPPFDDENMLRRGSLSLFALPANQRHTSYAQHVVAEELVTEFKEGKGSKTYWNVKNDNNHWLDATYYAAAAGRFCGVELLTPEPEVPNTPREVASRENRRTKTAPKFRRQHGANLQRRPNGWMQSIKRR